MPNRPPRDPAAEIEAILRDATARILAVLEHQQRQALGTLRQQLVSRSEPEEVGSSPAGAGATAARGRVRTEAVVAALRSLLSQHREGLRIAELREATGYADMQLHRALQLLIEAGEIRKEGPVRKTVYYPGPTRTRGRRQGGDPGRSSAGRRPPKSQWVSTPVVVVAVERALRGRRQGLRMTELCEATGFTDKQLHRALAALAEEGRIRKTGPHRAMRYQLRR